MRSRWRRCILRTSGWSSIRIEVKYLRNLDPLHCRTFGRIALLQRSHFFWSNCRVLKKSATCKTFLPRALSPGSLSIRCVDTSASCACLEPKPSHELVAKMLTAHIIAAHASSLKFKRALTNWCTVHQAQGRNSGLRFLAGICGRFVGICPRFARPRPRCYMTFPAR